MRRRARGTRDVDVAVVRGTRSSSCDARGGSSAGTGPLTSLGT